MKKNLFVFILMTLVFVFSGCKDKYSSYKDDIIGTWVAVDVNGETLKTDDIFVNIFTSDMKEVFAAVKNVDNGQEWFVEPECSYRLEDNILYEEGTSIDGISYSYKSKINIENSTLSFEVLEAIENGVNQNDNSSFTLRKISVDYSNDIVGFWKGKETSSGFTSDHDIYWQYLADGSYNYYYYNSETDSYVLKEDNNGKYFLYGDLLVSNYNNDINSGEIGRASESWIITISDGQMNWRGLRDNNIIRTFSMTKVDGIE